MFSFLWLNKCRTVEYSRSSAFDLKSFKAQGFVLFLFLSLISSLRRITQNYTTTQWHFGAFSAVSMEEIKLLIRLQRQVLVRLSDVVGCLGIWESSCSIERFQVEENTVKFMWRHVISLTSATCVKMRDVHMS